MLSRKKRGICICNSILFAPYAARGYIAQIVVMHRTVFQIRLHGIGFQRRTCLLLLGSCPCMVATIAWQHNVLKAGIRWHYLQLMFPGLDWFSAADLQTHIEIFSFLPDCTNSNAQLILCVGADHMESTASNISSVGGWVCYLAMALVLLCLYIGFLAMAVYPGFTKSASGKYVIIYAVRKI
jgi:hypothetical protein